RLARSLVVATMWNVAAVAVCAAAGAAMEPARTDSASQPSAARAELRLRVSAPSASGNEDALRHDAVDILLGVGNRADAAIHRHAGQPIGVQARDFLFGFEKLDHAHRRTVHGLVEVRVLDVRNEIFRGFLGRALHVFARGWIFCTEAMNALLDVDDLRHAT